MLDFPTPTGNGDFEQKRIFWFVRVWYSLNDTPDTYWNWLKEDKDAVHMFYGLSGRMSHRAYWPRLAVSKVEAILEAFIHKWPKVDLPQHWGTASPKEENAYRFLTELIWSINSDDPEDAIPVLDRFLADSRFVGQHKDLKSIHASQIRKKALRNFEPPTPLEIVERLDHDSVVTVEGLRQLVIQELQYFQKTIDGGEYNTADRFYEKGKRLQENRSTKIIVEQLHVRLLPQGISVALEQQQKDSNRCDFAATKAIGGKRLLLVSEVKGQWHKDLYTAAYAQLHERYSINPDAEQQGIYLVIWFGSDETVAGKTSHDIGNAQELKSKIEESLPGGACRVN